MAQMAVHAEHVLSLFLTEDVTFFFPNVFVFLTVTLMIFLVLT